MSFETFSTLMRTIFYIWIAIEFGNLAFLYTMGYKNVRRTKIIMSLQVLFTSLFVFFTTMSFVPIILILDQEIHRILVSFLIVTILPVGLSASWFRKESLTKQSLKLPKKDKKDVIEKN